MKTSLFMAAAAAALLMTGCSKSQAAQAEASEAEADSLSVVYFTEDITPESLVKIFEALGVEPTGNVCVKISTGESGNGHYLKPALIGDLVKKVDGTIVECCTAYGGSRQDPKLHWQTIKDHGFDTIAKVDIMDEFGEMQIPVADTTHLRFDLVGEHLANYDFMINLAHFKGHQMGGFGGVLKNASIGVASTGGKCYIHSAGSTTDPNVLWDNIAEQNDFIESMAAAAQGVHNYMNGKSADGTPRVVYIDVMNNMSVDCDCDGHPAAPEIEDMGILASLDPVALDQACWDKVRNYTPKEGSNNAPLVERVTSRHGEYILPYSEQIGLGSTKYKIVTLP
ncbi:MAG: DUF362 domain-containing protein [Bacteroidales bacterium]|nr:DUF362 domain-containing protein [Bacteroidales bacterium]